MYGRLKAFRTKAPALILAGVLTCTAAGCASGTVPADGGGGEDTAAQGSARESEGAGGINGLTPEPGAKLKLWDSDNDAGVKAWAEEMLRRFTEEYGIEVTFESVSHTDAPGKMKTDGPAKLGADVFMLASDHIGEMVEQGFIYPNDVTEPAEFMDAAIKACSVDGKLYGYPAAIETPALIYNKKLVSEAPGTFDELVEISRGLLDKSNNKYGYMMEVWNFYYSYAFIGGYGGYVFGKDGTDPNDIGLNSQAAVEAMEYYRSLKAVLPLQRDDISYDIKTGLFTEGSLAFDFNGPWAVQAYQDAGLDIGVAPMPLLPNGKNPTTFSGIRTFCVNTYSDYPMAAKLLAQFLTTGKALLRRYELAKQLPPRTDLINEPEIKDDPINSGFLQQAVYSQPMPTIPHMQAVWSNMETATTEIWNNPDADVQEELDRAVKNIMESEFYKN